MPEAGSVGATEHVDTPIVLQGLSGRPIAARFTRVGKGRRVVFLHGMLALNSHWKPLLEHISDQWQASMLELPLLDLRGDDCSMDGVTHLTHQFLDRYASEPAVFLGSSFGGHVALRIALERPEIVRGLVLAGAAGVSEKPISGDVSLHPTREWVRERIGAMFYDKERHITEPELDRAFRDLSERDRARAIVRLTRSSRKEYMGEQIHRIKAPTLVAWGKQDVITPPEAAIEFASRMPDARLVWFDKCSHAPMVEHPEQFAAAMNAFGEDLDRRDGK